MKNFIKKYKEYKYKKRLGKWLDINRKLLLRKIRHTFFTKDFAKSLVSSHAIIFYLSVLCIASLSVGSFFFVKVTEPYFDSEQKIIRRLKITGLTNNIPYLEVLDAIGSTNRIQVTLKTESDNHLKPKGTGLEKGSVNLSVTFTDGTTHEYALSNKNYSNFDEGVTDTFTLILPFGYTPFDVESYTISVLPDIKSDYGTWYCSFARVYFLLEGEPTLLATENWEGSALFGSGEGSVKSSTLKIEADNNKNYTRVKNLYNSYLKLASAGMKNFADSAVKSDVIDSLGFNGANYLYIDVETANIETQNNMLTFYTKGVEIAENDSLDYDYLLFLDVKFRTKLADGSFTKRYTLDTLGTDDFELGTTSTFKLEMPEGMCAFDISSVELVPENPYDSWAPRFIRLYLKPDYTDALEIARLSDTMLISERSTPVFYKNLIDSPVALDLDTQFKISDLIRKQLEEKAQFSLGSEISKMYFDKLSFYQRQAIYLERMLEIYSPGAYEQQGDTQTPETPENPEPDVSQNEDTAEPYQPETEDNTDAQPLPSPEIAPLPVPEPEPTPIPTPDPAPKQQTETEPEQNGEITQ